MLVVPDASAIAADLDLAQQSDKPAWAPQKTQLLSATTLSVVLVEEGSATAAGASFTIIVPAACPVIITRPIRKITKAGSGAVQVICEWFDPQGTNYWNDL